jgi:hypothetical protein
VRLVDMMVVLDTVDAFEQEFAPAIFNDAETVVPKANSSAKTVPDE